MALLVCMFNNMNRMWPINIYGSNGFCNSAQFDHFTIERTKIEWRNNVVVVLALAFRLTRQRHGPAEELLLLLMVVLGLLLTLEREGLVPELLKGSHGFNIETASKLAAAQRERSLLGVRDSREMDVCIRISVEMQFTWCTLKANLTPWSMSSSSSGPPATDSSSEETLFMYFIASFTNASLICIIRGISTLLWPFCIESTKR